MEIKIPRLIVMFKRSRSLSSTCGDESNKNSSRRRRRFSIPAIFSPNKNKTTPDFIAMKVEKRPNHPPRNINRTLQLEKKNDCGYGFTLETFIFLNSTGDNESKTVVRNVEEDGPAFTAGLRSGDVLVEVNGKIVEGTEHWDLTKIVSAAEEQLSLLVKFLDAVRHAELTLKLYERQAKIKAKFEEFELLCKREREFIVEGKGIDDEALIDMKDELYTETGLLSAPDNLVIKTTRFDMKTSDLSHDVKELKCDERLTSSRRGVSIPKFTTDYDLLEAYATNDESTFRNIYQRLTGGIKRSNSMPDTSRIELNNNRHDGRARSSVDGQLPIRSDGVYRPKTLSDSGYTQSHTNNFLTPSFFENVTGSLQRKLKKRTYKLSR